MRGNYLKSIVLWASLIFLSRIGTEAQDEHPWIAIANASVFPQRLLDHRDNHGWSSLRISLFVDAKDAYERRLPVAERLLYAFLWVDLLYEKESDYVTEWIDKMGKANRLHPNMPANITFFDGALGDRLSDNLFRYFFSNSDLLRDTYNQRDPSDLLTEAFSILDRLYLNNQYLFTKYPELAFAIAFVHDVPPPPVWPHPQVGEDILPRKLRSPDETFAFFTNARSAKWFHTSIKQLSLSEAIFLVDLIVTDAEVDWVRQHFITHPTEYDEVYALVKYDLSRLQSGQFHWIYKDYSLEFIMQVGGLCVDQAYFASQVGKVQGLPTIEFLGSGLDGRHAWFGYLNSNGKWEMDAGRYADQRFVTGHAFNPQTWNFISDHEVAFLGAGYRKSKTYFSSQLHYYWARLYSSLRENKLAEKAAGNAVVIDRRNSEAWSILINLRKSLEMPRAQIDASYKSALSALRTFSDLEARFISEYADYLDETGRENSARLERSRITYKNKDTRSDLAIENAVAVLEESMREDSRAAQMYVYRKTLHQVGAQGGIQVLDDLVVPFLNYLIKKGRPGEAKVAVLEAEKVLKPAFGSQMAKEIQKTKTQLGL
jgi:hypothetical protein